MMRWVILVLALGWTSLSFATDYYVGGTGASDNNPGTAAQPFATIQKAASVARAGDIVNIRSGTYRETVVPANSGSPGNPIIFQADGNATVILNGADLADGGWSVHTGNIYKKTITLPAKGYSERISNNTTLVANQVFVSGKMMVDARWPNLPNSDDLFNRNDFRYAKTGVSWTNRSINDGAIPNIAGGWTGGTIWANGWFISNSATITGHNGSQVNFNEDIQDKFRDYYYLVGRLGALDVEKEWFYDGNSSTLYLYAPGGGTPVNVEVKKRNWSFDLSNRSNITIRNITTFACGVMTNTSSPNIVIDGMKAKYVSHSVTIAGSYLQHSHIDDTGIRLVGDNSLIQNSVVEFSSDQGIVLGNNGVANNNLIHDISYCGAYSSAVYPVSGTNNHKITYNTIYRTGRSAVDMWHQLNMDIGYNDISQYGCLNIDLGAIYGSVAGNLTGTRIHHNWIHDTSAKVEGMEGIQTGIYFDQASGPCTVDHNVMWNNGYADIYNQQNTKERVAGSSWFYNNTFASTAYKTYVSYVTSPADVMRNNINRSDLNFNNGGGQSDVQNVLLRGVNPNFTGTGQGGLAYQLKAGSAAIDKGVVINGITDGSVGTPDIGAYEFGGSAWTAGYTAKPSTQVPNTPPSVNVTAPANNAAYKVGATINLSANATDANGSVSRVEFFYGTTKLGEDLTASYTFAWSNPPAGTYTITARATDNEGAITNSTAITVTVTPNSGPQVQLTAPATNTQFTAASAVTMTATATDTDGTITKVEFFQGTTKLGEDTSAPYAFTWNNVPVGTYSLTARATDNQSLFAISTPITITVVPGNAPPTVNITAPANNTAFFVGSTCSIAVTAADANGSVSKVEFFQGANLLGEDTSSPYTFDWTNLPLGNFSITAKATDNQAATTTSTAVTIVVAANKPPVVILASPLNNSTYNEGQAIPFTATATDEDGTITKVEFYSGTTKLGEDISNPFQFSWTNAPVGNYSLTASATDDKNLTVISAAITVTVVASNAIIPIVDAGENIILTLPKNTTTLSGTGTSGDGSSVKYHWTQVSGPSNVSIVNTEIKEIDLNNLVEGVYTFELTVTDEVGLTNTDQITVTVLAGGETLGEIPRYFSPNNDGINDLWEWPSNVIYENANLSVFNRFGQKLFEAHPYLNNWDGRSGGQPLQEDAYYYVIRLTNNTELQGGVRIVR